MSRFSTEVIQLAEIRMKNLENDFKSYIPENSLWIIRVDGRAFHTHLRNAEKPFDMEFIKDMQSVGIELCKNIDGTVLAYGQSDEISVIVDNTSEKSHPWFGGEIQKVVSVSAGIASATFSGLRLGSPHFDSRVFTVPSLTDASEYLVYRQTDAIRNSISMVAQSKFTQSQLHGISSQKMKEMLNVIYGIQWERYPKECRQGWMVKRTYTVEDISYIDKRTNETRIAEDCFRSRWEAVAAPSFWHGFLAWEGEDVISR